jgi:hypothetical protein
MCTPKQSARSFSNGTGNGRNKPARRSMIRFSSGAGTSRSECYVYGHRGVARCSCHRHGAGRHVVARHSCTAAARNGDAVLCERGERQCQLIAGYRSGNGIAIPRARHVVAALAQNQRGRRRAGLRGIARASPRTRHIDRRTAATAAASASAASQKKSGQNHYHTR